MIPFTDAFIRLKPSSGEGFSGFLRRVALYDLFLSPARVKKGGRACALRIQRRRLRLCRQTGLRAPIPSFFGLPPKPAGLNGRGGLAKSPVVSAEGRAVREGGGQVGVACVRVGR
jgi:hypothetical protein